MSPRLWNAYYALGITSRDSDGMTCVGITKKSRHCDAEIEKDCYNIIRTILDKIEASPPDASRWPKSLKKLSVHALCSRHQSQASDLVDEWTGCIQEAATTYDITSATKQLQGELDEKTYKMKELQRTVKKLESRGIAELHAEIEDLQSQRAADKEEHTRVADELLRLVDKSVDSRKQGRKLKQITQDRDDLRDLVTKLRRKLDLFGYMTDGSDESCNSDTDYSSSSTRPDNGNSQSNPYKHGDAEAEYELRDGQLRTQQLANRVDILEEELLHERAISSGRLSSFKRRLQVKEAECVRLTQENTSLRQNCNVMSRSLEIAMDEKARGRLRLAQLESTIEENQQSLASTELQYVTASQELNAVQLELAGTAELLAATRADLETSHSRQASGQGSINSLKAQLKDTNEALSSVRTTFRHSQMSRQAFIEEASKLTLELDTERKASADLRQELERSSQHTLEANSELRECQLELEALSSKTATVSEELAAEQKFTRSVRLELETRLQDLSTTNSQLGNARREIESTSTELTGLKMELDLEKHKSDQLREELCSSQQDLAVASNALGNTRRDLGGVRTSLRETQSSLDTCRQEIVHLHQSILSKVEENSVLTVQLHQKQTDLHVAQQDLSSTKSTLLLLQTSLEESHELNEMLRTTASEMEKEHATMIANLTEQTGGTENHPLRSLIMSLMELIQKWRDAVARYFRNSRSVRTLGASDDLEAALMIRKGL
ncbi:hypothetical protein BKA64DRAFT_659496 [Cadophora sp. MPI-SDFR-AT-0126]|nr:hypothetical protein BKA64DRAFT_659496 [Leotiomycetes sp. MPI-SDFR-AT-0126]